MTLSKYLIIGGMGLAAALTLVGSSSSKGSSQRPDVLTLSKKNTVTFRGVFDFRSVSKAQMELIALSSKLKPNDKLYLFLDTPGGSVMDGERLITTALALPQKITTVVGFAASMGFITAQSLGDRIILPDGVLMSHRAYIGVEGQIPGEFNTRSKFYGDILQEIETRMATRLNMTLADYQAKIKDEYWVKGAKAVENGMADKATLVACDEDLSGVNHQTMRTIFGTISVGFADCPLVSGPVSTDFEGLVGPENEISRAKEVITSVLNNRRMYAESLNVRSDWHRYVQ